MFKNSKVIPLKSKDFDYTNPKDIRIKHPSFKNCDGFIMIFADWCPFCQKKEQIWSDAAEILNGEFTNLAFSIAIIDTEDPETHEVCKALEVGPIPTFKQVSKDGKVTAVESEKPVEMATKLSELK